MDKNKQIEEMVIALTESQHEFDKAWHECLHNNGKQPERENVFYAKYLVDKKGYRKASEVVAEVFEQIRKNAFPHYYGGIPVVTRADLDSVEEELKKKYTEEGK